MAYGIYRAPRNARAVARPASDKQRDFARSLAEAVHGDNAPEFLAAHEEEGTFLDSKATSALIDALLAAKRAMPRPAAAAPVAEAETPEPGYYAVEYADVLRFYRVAEGKGKWEGRIFCNRYKSDELGRVGRAEQAAVYAAILADPLAAHRRFATETAHCWRCGRRLTDAESRARGIGPECARVAA